MGTEANIRLLISQAEACHEVGCDAPDLLWQEVDEFIEDQRLEGELVRKLEGRATCVGPWLCQAAEGNPICGAILEANVTYSTGPAQQLDFEPEEATDHM